ncbi:acyl carrier protein [Streptomyces canus]|uniref:Acyl carrier protein n=1 Tax=Streptomyces canus TaxID=58343 RepID=A0AAW8FR20_9ACTN|nr:acyl carrier protein [Streptomyces canus]MDQ0912403.1 acyl carrier protein [Streptomyces canus]MDQ1072390.1 acyl carrier protein [Streptomyces canus]
MDGNNRLTTHMTGLPAEARRSALLSLVRRSTAFALGHSTIDAVPEDVAFVDLGLTSFTAFELRSSLVEVTGIELPLSEIFEHPSPSALAGYLHAAFERLTAA